jgi:hypothetical protein
LEQEQKLGSMPKKATSQSPEIFPTKKREGYLRSVFALSDMSFLATSGLQSQVSPPPEALRQLFEAGKVLERQMGRDNKYPDLADLLMCNLSFQIIHTSIGMH